MEKNSIGLHPTHAGQNSTGQHPTHNRTKPHFIHKVGSNALECNVSRILGVTNDFLKNLTLQS